MTLDITGPAGRLEARLDMPSAAETQTATANVADTDADTGAVTDTGANGTAAPRAVVVVAAPDPQRGGTFQDRVVYHLTQGLLRAGCAVVRFNYRGVGLSAGAYDEGRGEQDDFRAVLDVAAARFPGRPLWAAGYSFGAHVALVAGAADPRVSLLIGVAVLPDMFDFSSMVSSPTPKFLIQGAHDELGPVPVVRRFYATLAEPRELVTIDSADHYFDGHASEVADAVEDLVSDFTVEEPGGSRHA